MAVGTAETVVESIGDLGVTLALAVHNDSEMDVAVVAAVVLVSNISSRVTLSSQLQVTPERLGFVRIAIVAVDSYAAVVRVPGVRVARAVVHFDILAAA